MCVKKYLKDDKHNSIIWCKTMLAYLSLEITCICSSMLTVFCEPDSRKTVHFSEQTNLRTYFCTKWRLLLIYLPLCKGCQDFALALCTCCCYWQPTNGPFWRFPAISTVFHIFHIKKRHIYKHVEWGNIAPWGSMHLAWHFHLLLSSPSQWNIFSIFCPLKLPGKFVISNGNRTEWSPIRSASLILI